jgi:hypothetical protein
VTARRRLAVATGVACSVAIVACGLGPGPSIGAVELTVTRDYGTERLLQRTDRDASESETAMRLLDRNADVSTRYGGGFVQSLNGIAGDQNDGRFFDWFFYVNGVESPIGAAEYTLHGGDRVWWDYRDWTAAMRVPAVVGSFPEPFLHGYEGRRHPVRVSCFAAGPACSLVRARLRAQGVGLGVGEGDPIRVLVGPWKALHEDQPAALLERGPAESGVFVEFEPVAEGFALTPLDVEGDAGPILRRRAGLLAAVRDGDQPPAWLVTGTDRAGTRAAARALDPLELRDRYALAIGHGTRIPVPLP